MKPARPRGLIPARRDRPSRAPVNRWARVLPVFLLAGAAAAAAPALDAPPEPGPQQALALPQFERFQLANGMRVVLAPRAGVPLVSARLLVRAGAEFDPPGQAGLASMTATLLGKGARRAGRAVDAATLVRQAEALGGALDSSAGWRGAEVALSVTTVHLPAALALLADVVRQPLLQADELARARAQTLDALQVSLSQPGDVASMALRRHYWGHSAYGASATPASLRRLSIAAVRAFHARHFGPARSTLVLAGALSGDDARRLAQAAFGGWSAGAAGAGEAPRAAAAAAAATAPAQVLIDMPGSGQSSVALAAPSVGLGSAERRVAELVNAVIGGGYSARLNQEVRIRRGLSYGVFSGAEAQPGAGRWFAQTQTQHASAAEVLGLMRAEVERLAREAPESSELAARQAALLGSFGRRLDTTAGLAALVAGQLNQGLELDELSRYVDAVMAVTPQQVRDWARRHWPAGSLRAVVAGDLGAGGAALAALREGAQVVPIDRLDLDQADLVKRRR